MRVKSCGNRSLCHGRWRSCGDWRWRLEVDTCRNVLVPCYPSTDRSAKKVHRKCHLPSFHDIRAYFVSRLARIFLWKRCFLFFIQLDIYYYITRDYVRGRLSKLRTFSLLKSRERKSVFEKIFNKYIFHREMNVKDEPVSRVYLTNVYIQRWTRVIHRNSGKKSRESLLTTSKKAVNWIFEMVTIIFETINISIRIRLLLIVIVKFFEFYVYWYIELG